MTGERLEFEVFARDGEARRGRLRSRHGLVETPAFMPVGTQGSVKALSPNEVEATAARMVIMNTYHLWQRPGPDIVHKLGGLHAFSRYPHTIVTDSGGFQAFSLARLCKLTEDGFAFSSHLDGARRLLSPEESMSVQARLGADIAMQLDVCPPGGCDLVQLTAAVERTTRWAERCLIARDPAQALFGIVQGGTNVALRLRHAAELARMPFDGLALLFFRSAFAACRQDLINQSGFIHLTYGRSHLRRVGGDPTLIQGQRTNLLHPILGVPGDILESRHVKVVGESLFMESLQDFGVVCGDARQHPQVVNPVDVGLDQIDLPCPVEDVGGPAVENAG